MNVYVYLAFAILLAATGWFYRRNPGQLKGRGGRSAPMLFFIAAGLAFATAMIRLATD